MLTTNFLGHLFFGPGSMMAASQTGWDLASLLENGERSSVIYL